MLSTATPIQLCHPFLSHLPALLLPLVSAEEGRLALALTTLKESKKEARSAPTPFGTTLDTTTITLALLNTRTISCPY